MSISGNDYEKSDQKGVVFRNLQFPNRDVKRIIEVGSFQWSVDKENVRASLVVAARTTIRLIRAITP